MRFSFLFLATIFMVFPAMAHVTAIPDSGKAGSYFETAFRVSHGCKGSDTISVSIQFPPGIVVAKPQFKPGWAVTINKRALDKPVPAGHGRMATEEFSEIIWSGGILPDNQYDSFGVLMKLPESPGDTLWFPVVQKCKDGSHEWIEIPAEGQQWHDVKSPAPFVDILPAHDGHTH
jgi:uncharacterized protein YcnI